jgi:hypothetical protein
LTPRVPPTPRSIRALQLLRLAWRPAVSLTSRRLLTEHLCVMGPHSLVDLTPLREVRSLSLHPLACGEESLKLG